MTSRHWKGQRAEDVPGVRVGWPGNGRGDVFGSVVVNTTTNASDVEKSLLGLMSWSCTKTSE